jgi:hypothetical protein
MRITSRGESIDTSRFHDSRMARTIGRLFPPNLREGYLANKQVKRARTRLLRSGEDTQVVG